MNSRTGIVVEIKHKKACIMTPDGEFTEVKIGGAIPTIGSTYTGITYKKLPFHKYIAAAACLVLFTSIGSGAYAYYTPTASVVVNINPALELKLNRWHKIIKTIALNEDGSQLANSIDIKNKDIDTGLTMILEEAERENFINKDETEEEPRVSLNITSSKDISLALPKFEEKASSKKLDVQIDYSKENAKDDIIKNGNKVEKDTENNSKKSKKTDSNSKSSLPKVKNDNKANDNKNNSDKANPKDSTPKKNSDKDLNNSNKNNKNTSTTKEKTNKTINNKKNSNLNSQPSKGKSKKSNNKTNNSKSNKNENTKK